MKRVALATYQELPGLHPDERLLAEKLAQRDVQATGVVWDAEAVDWRRFDAVVLRSCWDYHRRPDAFLQWIDALEKVGIPLWNAPALIRWNLDKSYLKDLAAGGVPVVPTYWCEQGTSVRLADVLVDEGWERAVVKPTVAATAYRTWVTSRQQAARQQDRFEALLATSDVMIQPFIEEIQTRGEWSFVFFRDAFSHAVIKRARAGEFRVQDDFGGTYTKEAPPPDLLKEARRALRAIPEPSLYVRVDGVERAGCLLIMEIELIEPSLFLDVDPRAADRFADTIITALHP